jgi:hypothetical protein
VSYLYLDVNLPVAAWAAGRGVLVPALSNKEEKGWVSVMLAILIKNEKSFRIKNEQIIEAIRLERYPNTVSRITGLFYFEDRDNAERAARAWRIFKSENLTQIELNESDKRTSRFDSNWYTYAPRDTEGVFLGQDIAWVDRYLSGEAMPTKQPIWECVTESRITVLNDELRERSCAVVSEKFPESLALFELARAAAQGNFDIGNITAFLRMDKNKYFLDWRLDMRESESPEFLTYLQQPGVIQDIQVFVSSFKPGTMGRTPDFRPYSWSGESIPGTS